MTLVYPLDHPHRGSPEDVLALVGGKAFNLGVMARELGLPVPPGFVITTEACRQVLAGGWPAGLDDEIRDAMRRVETLVGRAFGGPRDPLLVSVRSGAPVSMPGMMDTILDVGVTSGTAQGLAATGGDEFAADCSRRLRAMFRDVVAGTEPPDDPWLQLRQAVEAVFRSWNSHRARAYREREHIAADMGTAVTVQAMVFGNRDDRSATGVLFTRNPATGEAMAYGDVVFGAQGEDVVAGTHATEPIAVLDERLPDLAAELAAHAARLERHFTDLCDIEFTIESGRLWLLQVRVGKRSPEAALRMAVDMAEDPAFPLSREAAVRRVAGLLERPPVVATHRRGDVRRLTRGLGASPGIATGELVTDAAAAADAGAAGRAVILVRTETSPDDVHGMARAAGILTAQGGIASHAAVVARGWGIPAVVGASDVDVRADGLAVNGIVLRLGDVLSIDGRTGEVFRGAIDATTEVVPEARVLLDWARELGITLQGRAARGDAGTTGRDGSVPAAAADARADGPVASDALRLIGTKGFATADALAAALGCSVDEAAALVRGLVDDGAVVGAAGAYRLTADGKHLQLALLEAERDALGIDRIEDWFKEFLELDRLMKAIVTAWQVREDGTGPEPVLNDHSDPTYDGQILERLAALARDADVWLASAASAAPRLAGYRRRLREAAARAGSGDQRYVASPRVDSYHGIWFELHEDLIQLAGRTRAEEVAAGRA